MEPKEAIGRYLTKSLTVKDPDMLRQEAELVVQALGKMPYSAAYDHAECIFAAGEALKSALAHNAVHQMVNSSQQIVPSLDVGEK